MSPDLTALIDRLGLARYNDRENRVIIGTQQAATIETSNPVNVHVTSIVTELRQRLEALYGPRLVKMILYGSQARGDAEPGSDIDVLVVLRGLVRPGEEITRTSDIRLDVSLEHNTVVSCAYVSNSRYQTERSPFLLNVRREGVVV